MKILMNAGMDVLVCDGYYLNVSPFFIPIDNRDYEWDDDDWEFYNELGFFPNWGHFWLLVDGKWIVDVTADQFHPDEPLMYRVVIAPIGHPDYLAEFTRDRSEPSFIRTRWIIISGSPLPSRDQCSFGKIPSS